jgi:hypothetical protein
MFFRNSRIASAASAFISSVEYVHCKMNIFSSNSCFPILSSQQLHTIYWLLYQRRLMQSSQSCCLLHIRTDELAKLSSAARRPGVTISNSCCTLDAWDTVWSFRWSLEHGRIHFQIYLQWNLIRICIYCMIMKKPFKKVNYWLRKITL